MVQHRALLHTEPRMSFEEALALRVEDIGHLHGQLTTAAVSAGDGTAALAGAASRAVARADSAPHGGAS